MSYEIKEYNMSEISLGYSEEKCYSISEPVCKKGDLIRHRKTKNTYTVRQVLLYNVDHKYKNQRFGVGGTVVKSSASYLYYVSEHPSPYSEKEFTVVNKGLGETDEEYKERLLAFLTENAEPFRFRYFSWNTYIEDFGTDGECESPIGTIIVDYDDFEKMQVRFRERYFGLIKPTLQRPLFIIKHRERDLFVKSFIDKNTNTIIFFSVVKNENGQFELSSNHEKTLNNLLNKIREGQITLNTQHFTTALNSPDKLLPNYLVLSVGFPYRCKSN
jgi:hypothetical protein